MVLQNKGILFDGVRSSHKCQLMPAVYAVIPLCHLCSHSVDNHMSTAPKSSHQLHDGVVYYHTGTKSIVLSLAWKCQPPTLIAITCLWQNELYLDDVPVSPHSFGCLLLPGPAMHCQHRTASSFQHPCICQRSFLVREHPDLASHRHFQTLQLYIVLWQLYKTVHDLVPNPTSRKCRWPHKVKQTLLKSREITQTLSMQT